MEFRRFEEGDAEFCFRVRLEAFVNKFYSEIGPEAVAAGINAYLPVDYVRMSGKMPILIAENRDERIGFVSMKRLSETVAEIPLIYLKLSELGKGYGTEALGRAEEWIRTEWPDVEKIIIDTIIPEYNGGFYLKSGYLRTGTTSCDFPDMTLAAVRFEKYLKP
jgi:hypothetical protein